MPRVEKITSEQFPGLYSAFLRDDDPLSNENDWRNVFDYAWDTEHEHCGYVMFDGNRVVGMIGMVFSDRWIDESQHKLCNLHTWWVHEDYRGHSVSMLGPIVNLPKDYTVTHFTPCDTIRALTRRLGFRPLSTQLRVLLPGRLKSDPTLEVIQEPDDIDRYLAADERKIFRDHLPYRCKGLVVRKEEGYCFLSYTDVVRHRVPYVHVHYVSNLEFFVRHEQAVRAWLVKNNEGRFVVLDERLIRGRRFARSFKFWAPAHAMFRSTSLEPHQIDNLYSDVVMLRLTTFPHITFELRQRASRLLGGK